MAGFSRARTDWCSRSTTFDDMRKISNVNPDSWMHLLPSVQAGERGCSVNSRTIRAFLHLCAFRLRNLGFSAVGTDRAGKENALNRAGTATPDFPMPHSCTIVSKSMDTPTETKPQVRQGTVGFPSSSGKSFNGFFSAEKRCKFRKNDLIDARARRLFETTAFACETMPTLFRSRWKDGPVPGSGRTATRC